MYKLVISDDEGKTIIVPLVRDLITIGRQEGNTIRLTERNVSRQHARLVKVEEHFRIEDLDAYNGVRVNDERIQGSRDLQDGDRIGIGDYVLALRQESEAVTTQRPSGQPSGAAPGAALPARLVMVSAPAPGAEFSINKDVVRVGRLEELDLCISHRSISREHAELRKTDAGYAVQDLDSANGVRVNSSLIKESPLKSGDLLDLGQVRFRFVGPGEPYTFDADEMQSIDEPQLPMSSGRTRTLLIVGGAVALAVVLGLLTEDSTTTDPLQVQAEPLEGSEMVQAGSADGAEIAAQVAAALSGCRDALAAGDYDEALKSAQNGLMLDEHDSQLLECRNAAQTAVREVDAFNQGKEAFESGDVDAAYLLFAGLSADNPLREEPVVAEVVKAYAKAQLEQARAKLKSEPDEAARIASEIAGIDGLDESLKSEAEALRDKAEQGAPFPKQARPSRRPRHRRKTSPKAREGSGDGLSLADSPAKLARSCLARGDQKCAVRALEGRARNAQELALLIETYRALGDTKRAVRNMQLFVRRYPSAPQADGYKTFIARNSQ